MFLPTKCDTCNHFYFGYPSHCQSLEHELEQLSKKYQEKLILLEKIIAADGRYNDRATKEYIGGDLSEAIYEAAYAVGCAVRPLAKLKEQMKDGTIMDGDRKYLEPLIRETRGNG